jgi:hypothetical protein
MDMCALEIKLLLKMCFSCKRLSFAAVLHYWQVTVLLTVSSKFYSAFNGTGFCAPALPSVTARFRCHGGHALLSALGM